MSDTTQPADFLTVSLPNGGTWTRLDRLTDGRVMCCICFEYCTRDQLNAVEGGVEDVCKRCARIEAEIVKVPADACRAAHGSEERGTIKVCTLVYGHSGPHCDDRARGTAQ